jgi:hypothetical protein
MYVSAKVPWTGTPSSSARIALGVRNTAASTSTPDTNLVILLMTVLPFLSLAESGAGKQSFI